MVRGDTLGAIARRFGTATAALQRANHLPRADRIYINQVLEIPNGGGAWSPLVWSTGSVMTSDARVHIVQRGETLTQIAARYGRSVQALVAANDLRSPNRLQIGARLSIPWTGRRVGYGAVDRTGALPPTQDACPPPARGHRVPCDKRCRNLRPRWTLLHRPKVFLDTCDPRHAPRADAESSPSLARFDPRLRLRRTTSPSSVTSAFRFARVDALRHLVEQREWCRALGRGCLDTQ